MFEVMIIDDEKEIRDQLKSIIDWAGLDLHLSCEAGDSDTARELFLSYRPKIVITDINIPIISGFELAQEFTKIDPEVRFIVITGYNDFEHVKDSVKIHAVELILKPIMPDDMNTSLLAVTRYFEDLRNEQSSSQKIKDLLIEYRPMLLEKHLSAVLSIMPEDVTEDAQWRIAALGLEFTKQHYAVVLIAPDIAVAQESDVDTLLVATKNTTDELLNESGFDVYSYYDDTSALICLLNWDFEDENNFIEETINKIYEKMMFYFKVRLFSGIGGTVFGFYNISLSHREARLALNYQGILDDEAVVNYKNIKRIDAPVVQDMEQILKKTIQHLKNNHYFKINQMLGGYFNSLDAAAANFLDQVRAFSFAYVANLISYSISCGIDGDDMIGYSELLTKISQSYHVQSIHFSLCKATEVLIDSLLYKRVKNKNYVIELAKKYICENLSNEKLCLEMVSSYIDLSSVYFCRLFHKEVGISFTDYLNMERVSKAKKLLAETTLKVFEVSYMSGYRNAKHFNYVFKRIVGVTPLDYKNSTVSE